MEQKKKLVIKVLERLLWHRDIAQDLLVIIKSSYCTEEILDSLINLVSKAVKTEKWDEDKKLLEKSIQQIKKIQQMKENEKMLDEDLDKSLDFIE